MDEAKNHTPISGRPVSPDTGDLILQAAQAVLTESGQAGFTTRRVAERVGIALGNLTYHFPSKQSLVKAMTGRLLAHYLARFVEMLAAHSVQDGLNPLIQWLLDDALNATTVHIFREFWALALHDEEIASAMDDFYGQVQQQTADLLLQHYPQARPQDIHELIMLLALAAEGCIVLYGTRPRQPLAHERVVSLVQALAARLLQAAQVPE